MNPDELFKILKKNLSPRKLNTLEKIHQICTEQSERGSYDFSVATIARISEEQGGAKAQSIRNKTGETYRALIESWAKYKKPLKIASQKIKEKDAWVERIEKPDIKFLVLDLIAKNKKLIGENQQLKAIKELHIDMRPVSSNIAQTSSDMTPILTSSISFQSSERKALSHAIDEEELKSKGWSADERGRISDANGNVLFKVGFVSAIRKLLTV